MMATVNGTLRVCTDCLFFIANGDVPDTGNPEADNIVAMQVAAGVKREEADGATLHAGDGELGFSWSPCECCRRDLGGERHEVVSLQP